MNISQPSVVPPEVKPLDEKIPNGDPQENDIQVTTNLNNLPPTDESEEVFLPEQGPPDDSVPSDDPPDDDPYGERPPKGILSEEMDTTASKL